MLRVNKTGLGVIASEAKPSSRAAIRAFLMETTGRRDWMASLRSP
jgi:hypothetical protein